MNSQFVSVVHDVVKKAGRQSGDSYADTRRWLSTSKEQLLIGQRSTDLARLQYKCL